MSELKHHWLAAGQVITADSKGVERQKGFNTLLLTEVHAITRSDLANTQKAMMYRFVNEAKQIKGANIVDVFVLSISHLGLMSKEEFNSGFSDEIAQEAKPAPELN